MNIDDIQALLDGSVTIVSRIVVLAKGELPEIILTEEESIKDWIYRDERFIDNIGFVGQFVARTLEGNLQNIDDDFNIQDRELALDLGIIKSSLNGESLKLTTERIEFLLSENGYELLGEDNTEGGITYYRLGNFIVDKPLDNEVTDNTKFTATDYTQFFNITFNPDFTNNSFQKSFNTLLIEEKDNSTKTTTCAWLARYVCAQAGVELGSQNFMNSTFVISSNQFDESYNCRDVIKVIAQLAYSWARIDWDNKLYFDFSVKTTSESYNIINNNLYYDLETQKENYGPINRVLVGSSIIDGDTNSIEDTESIEENGLHELGIYDNPILNTEELREEALLKGNALFGLTYRPFTSNTTGHPWLKGNELLTITDMENNTYVSYPFNRVLTYDGHIKSEISALAQTGVEQQYTYSGVDNANTQRKITKIELDRENQRITLLAKNVSDNEEKVSQMEIDISGIRTSVTETKQIANTASTNASEAVDKVNETFKSQTNYYLATDMDSGVTRSTTGWQTDPNQAVITSTNRYLWTYNKYVTQGGTVTYSNPVITGVYGLQGIQGPQGLEGTSVTITSTSVKYAKSTSGVTTPSSGWQSSVPSISAGEYLWTRTIVVYSDNTRTTSYSVSYHGTDGTSVTIKGRYNTYAELIAEHPTGQEGDSYIVNTDLYIWSTTDGWVNVGTITGEPGEDGNGISDIIVYYAASTSSTTEPSNWQTTKPTLTNTNKYLWSYQHIEYTNSSPTDTTKIVIGVYGDEGVGISKSTTLFITRNSTAIPSAPTPPVTSTTTEGNTWTTSIPNYDDEYPYYFTCTQLSLTNGTYALSDVVRDGGLEDALRLANEATEEAANANETAGQANTTANGTKTELEDLKNGDIASLKAETSKISSIESRVQSVETSTSRITDIETTLYDENGEISLSTKTGFTMDATGFHVDKTGGKTKSTLDENALAIEKSSDNSIISYTGYVTDEIASTVTGLKEYTGQTVTYQENVIVNHYLQVPKSRIEEYNGGTGVFFTG